MSLQSLIDFAKAREILDNRRIDEIISIEEKAGQILAALYVTRRESVEAQIFLDTPKSFEHIMNILNNNIRGGIELRDAIENEVTIILREFGSEVVKENLKTKFGRSYAQKDIIVEEHIKEPSISVEVLDDHIRYHMDNLKTHLEEKHGGIMEGLKSHTSEHFKGFKGKFMEEVDMIKHFISEFIENFFKDYIIKFKNYIVSLEHKIEALAIKDGSKIIKKLEHEAIDGIFGGKKKTKVVAPVEEGPGDCTSS